MPRDPVCGVVLDEKTAKRAQQEERTKEKTPTETTSLNSLKPQKRS
jgi:hypothetical protein